MKTAYSVPGYNYAYERRWRHTLEFMNKQIRVPVLVTGEKTDFEPYLENYFGVEFDYTWHDLNFSFPLRHIKCNTVLSFQVIEHLLNPLIFLVGCKSVLSEDGLLYISYPTHGTKAFWSTGHFNEYDRSRFLYLIDVAGFEVVKYDVKNMWRRIKGVRSLIRNTPIGLCKHHYYCLKVK